MGKLGSGLVALKELIFWGVKLGRLEGGKCPADVRPGLLALGFATLSMRSEKTQSFT